MPEETERPDADPSLLAFAGSELRRLRRAAGLTQAQLAKLALATQAMVSYVETGSRIFSADLADELDRVFDTGGFFARIHPLVLRHAYPAWFLPYVELEGQASLVRVWHGHCVPGLLQTEAYARLTLGAARPADLEPLVAARMSRRALFEREERPRTWFVIAESALRGFHGHGEVMHDQLAHLLTAGRHPHNVIQVLPDTAPPHPGLSGAFAILDLPEGETVMYADAFHRGRMTGDKTELTAAAHAYDLLRALALPPDESARLIGAHAERTVGAGRC